MDTFKEFLLKEQKQANFCYMIYPEGKFLEQLAILQENLHLNAEKLVPKDELHCTIRYCKLIDDQDNKKFVEWLSQQQLPIIEAFTAKFSQFDEGALVVELESQGLREWYNKVNEWMTNTGHYAKSDYELYKPHISLAYGCQGPVPLFEAQQHRMNVKFTSHRISNTNKTFVFVGQPQEYKGLQYN